MQLIRDWFSRHLNDPQVVGLGVVLLIGFGVVIFLGDMLAPVLASVVLAYLLEGLVRQLEKLRVPRLGAVVIVFGLFVAAIAIIFFSLIPTVTQQLGGFVESAPDIVKKGGDSVRKLFEQYYPDQVSEDEIGKLFEGVREKVTEMGNRLTGLLSLQSLVVAMTAVVYLILVPILVFFFLKDKHLILGWLGNYMPRDRGLATQVWHDVDIQMGNYVRGKFVEILIVGFVTLVTFSLMGLPFALLLSVVVGLSVIVPYIGATVVTLPVAAVAYFEFGPTADFVWIMVAYGIIQALDGNVLVPLLFSEVVNLHPVAIIVAILVFGGIWGFWGVFFAIPLATLIQSVLKAWPRSPRPLQAAGLGEEGRERLS